MNEFVNRFLFQLAKNAFHNNSTQLAASAVVSITGAFAIEKSNDPENWNGPVGGVDEAEVMLETGFLGAPNFLAGGRRFG